jgi:hypothetical protein
MLSLYACSPDLLKRFEVVSTKKNWDETRQGKIRGTGQRILKWKNCTYLILFSRIRGDPKTCLHK